LDYLSVVLQLAFYVLFLVTLARFLRRPSRLDLAVVAIFGSTAALFGYSLINGLRPGLLEPLRPLIIGFLLIQPVLVFWMVSLVQRVPRWLLPLTIAGFVISELGITFLPPRTVPLSIFVAGYFIAGEGGAGLLLIRGSQRRYGLARVRLALAGLGAILFGASIFISAIGSAAAGSAPTDPTSTLASRVGAILAALAFLAAFAPPRGIRSIAQRAIAFDLSRDLVSNPSGTEPVVLWRSLALAARDILGANLVEIKDAAGAVVASTDVVASEPAAADVPSKGGLRPARVDLALSAERGAPHLIASIDGQPLFIEDDIAAVRLLGSLTIRSVEREEAVIHLAEAKRELEAAAAVRASEARFIALLAADPNAVLAVDSAGMVSWATGLTGDIFGRPAEELAGTALADLVDLESMEGVTITGEDVPVRRLQAIGRRNDGVTFPADVAITPFQLDDLAYQLYVVSDASWRHEANLMRDRFLGILSHELRTPITSIYGGTQLLLKRSDRLDPATRTELMTSVAAEAERLQRIIENLLVLARVERGADFFDPRPVTLKAVLTEFVGHESRLWPEMHIKLTLGRGLPLVAADEEYLALILRNLISNAAKYAGERSTVEIVASQAADGDGGAEEVTVQVFDNGPGIGEAEADQLFGLYYRSSEAAAAPGAGIGLFVCRGLVNAMGGRIWARPRPEGGAEFGFSLPVYAEQTVTVTPPVGAPARAVAAS
jgi:signal transduction histidine kinase/PAS domain-containing protein